MDLRSRMRARLPKASTGNWYSINAEADTAVIRIYSEIGFWGVSAEDFANDLAQIRTSQIEVQLNSPGGDAFDGIAIYNALRAHPARIVTRVDGVAASAASFIAQAGDHRQIMTGAQEMIHEAWGLAVGPAGEMREFADLLDRQNAVMASIYAERTGGDIDHIRELMAAETWFTGQEAVDAGFADEVYVPARKEAKEPAALAPAIQFNVGGIIPMPAQQQAAVIQISSALGGQNPDPTPVAADINQDAARNLLAAFTPQGGTPNE